MKASFKLALLFIFLLSSCSSSKIASNEGRDGSSFEKAIIVNSISEEYEYVKKVCPSCQFKSQALTRHNRKPYDILYFKMPNGEEVSYYFDISKFFGKGF